MQSLIKKRVNPYDAFLRSQMHMIELAKAYVDNLILKEYQKIINQFDQASEEYRVLNTLYNLFALHTIYENRGWYLEHDYMHGSKSKAIRRMITKLCKDVRSDAAHIVDTFGISDDLLGAEIIKT